jgi:hypothetical protein
MVSPTFRRKQPRHVALLAGLWLAGASTPAAADDLANRAFQLKYDASGVTSLKRTADVADTDYIAANGALGRLIVRYRTSAHGDWKELRDLIAGPRGPSGMEINYALGALLPTIASRASGSAVQGVAGLRGLNDGIVPRAAATGGRGGGPGTPGPGTQGLGTDVPVFTWTPSRGATQWVQYTFPAEETLGRTEVFWTVAPQSWRLLYQDGGQWREVAAKGAYGRETNAFSAVEFVPVKTMALRIEVTMTPDAAPALAEWRVGPDPALAPSSDLAVHETFRLLPQTNTDQHSSDRDVLEWTITLTNEGSRPVEIGDLAVPFAFAERAGARGDIYTKKLLRHSLVAGHGSWIYWQRSNAVGPYLVMTPAGETKFEYFDSSGGAFTPYVHARAASAVARAAGGNWRLPVSSLTLQPKGTATYTFRFQWAKDVADVRDVLFREGKFDTTIAPGMVVPVDLPATISLRTKNAITAIAPEHASATRVDAVAQKPGVYAVKFSQLGENMLTIKYGSGQWSTLEFFVTEPLETVIRKRAAFLVSHHQHTDPSKWYVGMYSDWDQKNEIRRSPEDRDSLSAWLTDANDDAGNARPAFIASKNVFLPEQKEIDSLELYIGKYLWGGMQMTDREKYPYAVYGIPNWKANRASADEGRNGQAHVWRIYDYPHIVMLYFRMYQIGKFYPAKVKYLDAAGYLERAYRTAIAYWTVPSAVEKWSADAVGTMNEAFIPDLIDALETEGKADWAKDLRGHWEGKVERFINRTPNLYGSEFAFDSTGFESTGAFAGYANTHRMTAVTTDAAKKFTEFQLSLNMADRGWLETTYYQMGSDYRGSLTYLLSYMSQMGGWAILDYGLRFATDPAEYLRLGYASSLSSWALVNSGTKESGYGYWFPSANNDGATGGGFMPEPQGRAWIGKQMTRGAWFYSAEEDVGYCAAIRTHATVVTRDPVLGEIAYGALLTREGTAVKVIPRDGLRVRFHVIRGDQRLHMELDHDGYAKEQPIVVSDDLSRIQFTLENRTGGAHQTGLSIVGLPAGDYEVAVDGKPVGSSPVGQSPVGPTFRSGDLSLPIGSAPTSRITIQRR